MTQAYSSAWAALAAIWEHLLLPPEPLRALTLTGDDPVLPSSFRVGTAAQVAIAGLAAAANAVWQLRTGRLQSCAVEMRHAALEFRSERYMRVDGGPAPELWDRIAGLYRCGDGRYVRIHTNFPHHRDGLLRLLNCAYSRAAVHEALRDWTAEAVELAAAEAGLVVSMQRSFAQWDRHPQGQSVATLPLVSLQRMGEAPPRPWPTAAQRPLSGLRVLDLTRVIAGPVCGRALAAHGADVLNLCAAHLPSIDRLVIDTGRGKRSAFVDLRTEDGRATLTRLLAQADILVQSYRPGALAARGFGPDDLAAVRPGLILASLSAYGEVGPWAQRRGFDSIVQTASGFNTAEADAAGADTPRELPCQALDHAAGYLLALGTLAALIRRATEGGSWHVRVSLARTGHWLRELGRVEAGLACADPTIGDIAEYLEESSSGFGRLLAVRHAATMSATPPHWARPSPRRGTHAPSWEAFDMS